MIAEKNRCPRECDSKTTLEQKRQLYIPRDKPNELTTT